MIVVRRKNRGVLFGLLDADVRNCVTLSLLPPPVKINVQTVKPVAPLFVLTSVSDMVCEGALPTNVAVIK